MAINHESDHKGRERIVVSKYWPDGSRFRRYFPNMTVAKKTMARIEESIAMGTWPEMKEELARGVEQGVTVSEFSKIYLQDYCRNHNTRPDFKKQALTSITRILGGLPLKDLRRSHAHQFIAKRSREVAPATVNRGLAVLKNMLTFAVEKEHIEVHPLLRFRMLPEEQKALRVMTLEEERKLVEAVAEVDPTIGAYVAVLGETGLRKSEGLNLKWGNVNVQERILAVEETKSGKPRYISLSDFALQWLNSLVRVIGCPHVFVQLEKRDRWRDPRGPFKKGRKAAGLEWVGFHDLRHFRATQWVKLGVDLVTVKELLGHSDMQTTMRYAHFAPSHAKRSILQAQRIEVGEIERQEKNRREQV
jgi:integrase